jgi:hypothetical protein
VHSHYEIQIKLCSISTSVFFASGVYSAAKIKPSSIDWEPTKYSFSSTSNKTPDILTELFWSYQQNL